MKLRVLARLLKRGLLKDRYAEQVEADYARMQDPKYAERALEAERELSTTPSFRRFGQPRR